MDSRRQGKAVSVTFFFLGIGMLVAAGVFAWRTQAFVAQSVSTPGRVIEMEYRSGVGARSGGGEVAVFTFTDSRGRQHTNRAGAAQSPSTHQIGASVTVLYSEGQPETAQIRGFRTLWILPTFLGGFGVAFTAFGLMALAAVRKTHAQHTQLNTARGPAR
jgi:hypothetical protein